MGGKSSTSTSSVQIPPQVLAQYSNVTNQANQLMGINPSTGQPNTPFQIYSTDPNAFVAPLTAEQNAGIAATNQYAGAAQPFYGASGALTLAGAGPANLGSLNTNQYMSPYMGDVVNSMLAAQKMQNAQQASQLQGQAVAAGAYGGDRSRVAQANLAYQQNLANQQALAGALQSGYTQAQNTAAQQQAAQLAVEQANLARLSGAGAQLGNLGTAAQTAGLQGAQAMQAAGLTQQQTQQAGLQALYNQFQQQQAYPFQLLGELANISEGIGALSGSTTTTTQPSSFFSDERLKEDIQPIGETYDGQKIVKFRYKGHPGKQIGLIAQDVEKHHPDAVGLAGGYKTVDYDRATKAAADRGHYYSGGLVPSSEGGAVGIGHYGEGFADGGSPIAMPNYDPNYLMQMIAAQKQMFGSAPGGGLYGSSGMGGVHPGVGGPASSFTPLQVGGLKVASAPPPQQPTMSDVANTVNTWAQAGSNLDKGLSKLNKAYQGSDLQNLIDPTGYQSNIAQQNVASGAAGLASGGVASYAAGGSTITPYHDAAMYSPQTLGAPDVVARASGGLVPRGHFDVGGTPYDPNQDPNKGYMKLGEADQPNAPKQVATAQPPSQSGQSPFSQLLGTAASIASIASMFRKGGRVGYDDGGTPVDSNATDNQPTDTSTDPNSPRYLNPNGRSIMDVLTDRPTREQILANRAGWQSARDPLTTGFDMGMSQDQLAGLIAHDPSDPLSRQAAQEGIDRDMQWLAGRPTSYPTSAGLKPNDYVPAGTPGAEMPLYDYTPSNTPHWNPQGMTEIGEIPSNDSVANDTVSPASAAAAAATGPDGVRQTTTGTFANTPAGLSPHAVPVKPAQPAPSATPPAAGAQTGFAGGATSATPAAPAAAAGVAGAPAAAAGVTPPAKGDWMSRNQDWLMPLLSGVGAMASSPSRYLGAALLQGVGAGAGAYENVQNQMQQRAEAAATTNKIKAETAASQMGNFPGFGPGYRVIDPKTGAPIFMSAQDYQAAIRSGNPPQLLGTSLQPTPGGASALPPTISPHLGSPGVNFSPDAVSAAKTDVMSGLLGEADEKRSADYLNAIKNDAIGARTNRVYGLETATQLANGALSGGLNTPGFKGTMRAEVLNALNTIARGAGMGNEYFGSTDTSAQLLNKINTLNASGRVQAADQHAWSAFQAQMQANPNLDMNPQAAATIAATMLVNEQRKMDKDTYTQMYRDAGAQLLTKVDGEFEKDNNWQTKYQPEVNALKDLMLSPNGARALNLIMQHGVTPEQIDEFFYARYHLNGMSRFFGGS